MASPKASPLAVYLLVNLFVAYLPSLVQNSAPCLEINLSKIVASILARRCRAFFSCWRPIALLSSSAFFAPRAASEKSVGMVSSTIDSVHSCWNPFALVGRLKCLAIEEVQANVHPPLSRQCPEHRLDTVGLRQNRPCRKSQAGFHDRGGQTIATPRNLFRSTV